MGKPGTEKVAFSLGAVNCIVGSVAGADPDGRVLVDYPGNPLGPMAARSIVDLQLLAANGATPAEVLLVFDNGDPCLPVILGIVRQQGSPFTGPAVEPVGSQRPEEVFVDGQRVIMTADHEIELRCGKSSLLLTRAGKIVIKGVEIVSRASRTNKIKGSSVTLN